MCALRRRKGARVSSFSVMSAATWSSLMFTRSGMCAASRFILVVWRRVDMRIRHAHRARAAMQWHASRSVCHRTKGIDLAVLIVYNLSNWTGLRERAMPQGLPFP
jgi:hypothetical protein